MKCTLNCECPQYKERQRYDLISTSMTSWHMPIILACWRQRPENQAWGFSWDIINVPSGDHFSNGEITTIVIWIERDFQEKEEQEVEKEARQKILDWNFIIFKERKNCKSECILPRKTENYPNMEETNNRWAIKEFMKAMRILYAWK